MNPHDICPRASIKGYDLPEIRDWKWGNQNIKPADRSKASVVLIKRNRLANFTKPRFIIILILAAIFLGGLIYNYFSKESLPPIVYRIAIDETWYPLQLFDKEQDITIFSEEIARAIAEKQHFPIQLIRVGSENLFTGLDNGEYEAVLSSLLVLEENVENYIVSNPYYLLGPVLVVSSSSHIKSLKDLNGKSIGIIIGLKPIISLYKNTSINFVFYDYNYRYKLIDDVSNNVIDGMILSLITAYEYTKNGPYQNLLKVVSKPLTNDGLRLIAKKNPESKKLIEQFNEGLKAIKKNGVYNQLLLKWGLFNPEKL